MAKLKLIKREQIALIREQYPNVDTDVLADQLGLSRPQLVRIANGYGIKKSPEALAKLAAIRVKKSGNGFKKGYRPYTAKPIGSTRINSKGMIVIKVAESNKWMLLHQKNWEDKHGKIPSSHLVGFKDKDKLNCSPENLILVSKRDELLKNSVHNLPPEIKELVYLRGNILRCITNRRRKESGKQ